jgi:D-alanyl-lipoteichoic acid acyltransferase DltB (MBOAT superfamily)
VWLFVSVITNLGLLGYFKYTGFLFEVITDVAALWGGDAGLPALKLILPVGISFYTFQSLSYTIDVWRERLTPEPSFSKFALFVTFFPQLVAGPIVRANELLPQLHRRPKLDPTYIEEGMFRIFKGLVKKVVLGDWIAVQLTDRVFTAPEAYTSAEIMLALYAFTLQIYADFSGYSDIAIGVARLLGFRLPENFDRPHQARNLGEFWRRWHMTLSTWLRDYLFFPLGGSRGSRGRVFFNLWLTMFLVGMWHYSPGTSWNFVIYGNLHAFAMVYNRWNRTRDRSRSVGRRAFDATGLAALTGLGLFALGRFGLDLPDDQSLILGSIAFVVFLLVTWLPQTGSAANTALHILITFHFTVVSRIFFRTESFDVAKRMCAGLLELDTAGLRPGLLSPWLWLALIVGTAYHFTPRNWVDVRAYGVFRRLPGPVLGLGMGLLALGLMKLMSGAPRAFIYFSF